jgi:diguanylate cyclase (GGDEF)-like protein
MFLDLDRFKMINDTLGHDTGDRFLQAIGIRLEECLRERDTVSRFGGDEFAIILEDMAQAEDAAPLASKILEAFGRPFEIGGHEYYVTTSIGISLYPSDGTDAQTLLKNADAAMYQAKELGKNTYQFYSADMGAHAIERLTLETSLRHALERNEFVLHYQPQVALADGRIVGVEALLRWQHPQLGLLAPAQFIGLAEETGTIVPIGQWVARAACRQAKLWDEAGLPPLRVAINVSARQFNEPSFVDGIAQLLAQTRFDAGRLELEITESVIMKNAQVTVARLQALHAMGVRFAVDDFGTGYSSLSYLRRFAVHTLKIDRSFIHDITADQGDAEIVKTIIAMARGLKLAVIAEGVETKEQLAFLRGHGCEAVQGYLLSRPLPADQIPRLLAGPRLIG